MRNRERECVAGDRRAGALRYLRLPLIGVPGRVGRSRRPVRAPRPTRRARRPRTRAQVREVAVQAPALRPPLRPRYAATGTPGRDGGAVVAARDSHSSASAFRPPLRRTRRAARLPTRGARPFCASSLHAPAVRPPIRQQHVSNAIRVRLAKRDESQRLSGGRPATRLSKHIRTPPLVNFLSKYQQYKLKILYLQLYVSSYIF